MALMLRLAFYLPLRHDHAVGFPRSLHLLFDSTGLKVCGAGTLRARRTWRELHLAVDANSGMIVAPTLTEQDGGEPVCLCHLTNPSMKTSDKPNEN